jgi:steroid delta-isomerase-like uncharacterized protein
MGESGGIRGANTELCVRANQELFGRGKLEVADEVIAEDIVNHASAPAIPAAARHGREAVKKTVEMIHRGFSDIRYEIEDAFESGDRVVLRLTMHGTHTGELFGRPPSGKSFSAQHIHVFRVEDGLIREHWAARDDMAMMRQIGALGELTHPRVSLRR